MTLGNRQTILQFIKYIVVGGMNTLITLMLIFIFKSLLGANEYISNAIGYVGGFINSFLWNKKWVFRATDNGFRQLLRFLIGFLVCYALQFAVVWLLTEASPLGKMLWHLCFGFSISGYGVATLVGMVFYTIANYIYNRFITFRI